MPLFLIAARAAFGRTLSAIWRILSRLTLWQAVSLALACLSLWLYHGKQVEHRARLKAEAQVTQLVSANKAAAAEAKRREAQANQITSQLRKDLDAKDRQIAADAAAIGVHPGKAGCAARVPQRSAGATPADRGADAPRPEVLTGDWWAVPGDWLNRRAQGYDQLLNYMLQDQEWHRQQEALQHPEDGKDDHQQH